MKKYLSKVTGGADLLRPKLSIGYIVAAVVAVAVLLAVITGGKWLYAKAGRIAQGVIPSAENVDYKAKLGI
jgi:hypothetical protein